MNDEKNVKNNKHKLSFGFLLNNNFTLSAFACFIDVIRLSADELDLSKKSYCTWEIIGVSDSDITCSAGFKIKPTILISDEREFNYLVVTGGTLYEPPFFDNKQIEYIRQSHAKGVKIVSLCTGFINLIESGILKDGHKCAINKFNLETLKKLNPNIMPLTSQYFYDHKNFITCPGGINSAYVARYIIEAHFGRLKSLKAMNLMLINENFDNKTCFGHGDSLPQKVLLTIDNNLNHPLSNKDIAKLLNVSTSKLEKEFSAKFNKSIQEVYKNTRLEYAKWLIENTKMSFTQIANVSGYNDSSYFTRDFKKNYSLTPKLCRQNSPYHPKI